MIPNYYIRAEIIFKSLKKLILFIKNEKWETHYLTPKRWEILGKHF